jgi:ferredoxin
MHLQPDPPPMTDTVRLELEGQVLEVPCDQTLLRSLLNAGLAWPASCRNGSCRVCIAQLTHGQVRHGVEWPGLLPEEKAAGCVLPCVAFPLGDLGLIRPGAV